MSTMPCVLLSVGTCWELRCCAQRAGEDPPVGPVGQRAGLSLLPDGWRLRPAAVGASPPPGPEPQRPAGVPLSSVPGTASDVLWTSSGDGRKHKEVSHFAAFDRVWRVWLGWTCRTTSCGRCRRSCCLCSRWACSTSPVTAWVPCWPLNPRSPARHCGSSTCLSTKSRRSLMSWAAPWVTWRSWVWKGKTDRVTTPTGFRKNLCGDPCHWLPKMWSWINDVRGSGPSVRIKWREGKVSDAAPTWVSDLQNCVIVSCESTDPLWAARGCNHGYLSVTHDPRFQLNTFRLY